MQRRKQFSIVAMSALAAVTAALAQTAEPRGNQPIPDFSGVWAHPSLPGFELPLSGPGPVTNKSRRPNGVGNIDLLVGDYTNPILKPEAAEIVKQHGEMSLAGVTYPTPTNQCWPGGVPHMLWNLQMQMLQQPHEVTILYWFNNYVRHVRLNQPHRVPVTPSLQGDSVGYYEGDTLVIDTVGIKPGPFAMVDQYGTPHSPALHVVERYRLLDYKATIAAIERDKENFRFPANGRNDAGLALDPDDKGNGVQLEFTVEDEGVFTTPWSATVTYQRAAGGWAEHVCAENPHEYYANKDSAVPQTEKPDF